MGQRKVGHCKYCDAIIRTKDVVEDASPYTTNFITQRKFECKNCGGSQNVEEMPHVYGTFYGI